MSVSGATRLLLAAIFCAVTALAQTPQNPAASQPPPAQQNQATQNPTLPEAPYVPLSTHEKFHTFVRQTYSPYTFVSVTFNATYSQMTGDPYEYGGGMEGFGKRFGASLANTEASRFFNRFLFPTVFRSDPRYFPAKPNAGAAQRAWYAATRVLVTRYDSGKNGFNYPEMFGNLCTVGLENAYFPQRERTFGDTMNRFAGSLFSDATSNLTREFWPDIRRLFKRHEPKKVKQIEEQIQQKIPPSMRPDNN